MDERLWSDGRPGPMPAQDDGFLRLEPTSSLVLISGRVDLALHRLAPGCSVFGLAEVPATARFFIRTARDAGVLVSPEAVEASDGWQPEGYAVTQADDLYLRLTMCGPDATPVVRHLLDLDKLEGSRSAAIRMAGRTVLLTGERHGYTLWIDPADRIFLSAWVNQHREKRAI